MDNIVTIIVDCPIKLINGKNIKPKIYNEYEYINVLNIEGKKEYILIVDKEEYEISEDYITIGHISMCDRRSIGTIGATIARERYFVSDMKEQVLEVLGIDIKAGEHADYNGRNLQLP